MMLAHALCYDDAGSATTSKPRQRISRKEHNLWSSYGSASGSASSDKNILAKCCSAEENAEKQESIVPRYNRNSRKRVYCQTLLLPLCPIDICSCLVEVSHEEEAACGVACRVCSPLHDLRDGSVANLTARKPFANYVHRRRSSLLFYWHAISLFACLITTGFCMRTAASQASLLSSSNFYLQRSCPVPFNPILRISRSAPPPMSYVWTSSTATNLCSMSPLKRHERLRNTYLFHNEYSESQNIRLSQLFLLDDKKIYTLDDLARHASLLKLGTDGADCLIASNSTSLARIQIQDGLIRVASAFNSFNRTLHRFDCMLAMDSATATRPFSPNGSCSDCKMWYRRWLLMQMVQIWLKPPCTNWCYYAQLACPHLASFNFTDYAGHPSFQCRDLQIPRKLSQDWQSSFSSTKPECRCVHPCDLIPWLYNPSNSSGSSRTKSIRSIKQLYTTEDTSNGLFPASNYCEKRRRVCLIRSSRKKASQKVRLSSENRGTRSIDEEGRSFGNANQQGLMYNTYGVDDVTISGLTEEIFNNIPNERHSSPGIDDSRSWAKLDYKYRRKEVMESIAARITLPFNNYCSKSFFLFYLLILYLLRILLSL